MNKDTFAALAERRAALIAEIDEKTITPAIRNHLVQLFRKAHAKDHGLTGCNVGMGRACPTGRYLLAERDDEGNIATSDANDWRYGGGAPMYQEVADFLGAVDDYCQRLCSGRADELPYIADITLADLETTRTKKAAVYGPKGLRARLNSGG